MKYKFLALDLDGTLLDPDDKCSDDTLTAVQAAEAAGLRVCLATGRSYAETMAIWRGLELQQPYEPLVLIGGAMVSEPDTGRTLYQRTIPRALACKFADALGRLGCSAMVFVDAWRCGVDYFLTGNACQQAVHRDWFERMSLTVRRVNCISDVADLPSPLRVSAIVAPCEAEAIVAELKQQFDGELGVHAINVPNYGAMIVEAFAAGCDKFTALKYIVQAKHIVPGQMVAVGDDVNDVAMIRGAGLGVAMPNAPAWLRDTADHVAEGGLADFIRRLLVGGI